MFMAVISFATYPNSLFTGYVRVLLFTLIPAGFVGAVPVMIIQQRSGWLLLGLAGTAVLFWLIALLLFYTGLRRYESGSAINVNV
jgi:ABC-2 type transport system permease protein